MSLRFGISRSAPRPCRRRGGSRDERPRGFTIVELLTVLGIVGLLLALVVPAVGSAREAARRTQCVNQLRQIGLALHGYHELHRSLPSGWQWEPTRRTAFGWGVALLPLLEERAIHERIDLGRPVDDPGNAPARQTRIPLFACPSDVVAAEFTLFEDVGPSAPNPLFELPTANYVGVFGTTEADDSIPAPPGDGTFFEGGAVGFKAFRRGLGNTLVVGERTTARVPSTWLGIDVRGEDAACRLVGSALVSPNCDACDECEFDSRHAGGANFLWGDGHVRLISKSIDVGEYQRLARRSD